MKWVETDLNSPWHPIEDPDPHTAKLARMYPEQCRWVSNDLAKRLKAAWDDLLKVSAEVDKKHPIRKRK